MPSRFLRIVAYVGLGALGFVVAILVAWVVDDYIVHGDTVARNVSVGGQGIGGLGPRDLNGVLEGLAAETGRQELTVNVPGRALVASNDEVGIGLDTLVVAQAAFDAGRTDGVVRNFTSWLGSWFTPRAVHDAYSLDEDRLLTWVQEHPDQVRERPVEPSFSGAEGELEIRPGTPGARVGGPPVVEAVAVEVENGRVPVTVEVEWSPIRTRVNDATFAAAVAEAERIAGHPLTVRVEDQVVQVGQGTITRWIESERDGSELRVVLQEDRIQEDVERLLADFETEGVTPTFAIVDGEVEVEYGTPPMRCCDEAAAGDVIEALTTGAEGAVALPLVATTDPDAQVEALGINEVVGEFTTNHACCENRVQNIHRIADIVRGVVILPGEQFSINEYVGRRTTEGGFVPAGTIQQGRFVDGVGGGISQFATTMFNAAFFGGLDFIAYQSHSIYISRYPRGREATLSYPVPDLIVENNTPYGMLVWTSYTDTSITVQLWSTDYFETEQTGQASFPISQCTRVETYRRRVAPDGEVLDDMVFATYRPGEGLDCNGNETPDNT